MLFANLLPHILKNNCFAHLPWEIVPTDMFNKYRERTSWEAFLGWKAVRRCTTHACFIHPEYNTL